MKEADVKARIGKARVVFFPKHNESLVPAVMGSKVAFRLGKTPYPLCDNRRTPVSFVVVCHAFETVVYLENGLT